MCKHTFISTEQCDSYSHIVKHSQVSLSQLSVSSSGLTVHLFWVFFCKGFNFYGRSKYFLLMLMRIADKKQKPNRFISLVIHFPNM